MANGDSTFSFKSFDLPFLSTSLHHFFEGWAGQHIHLGVSPSQDPLQSCCTLLALWLYNNLATFAPVINIHVVSSFFCFGGWRVLLARQQCYNVLDVRTYPHAPAQSLTPRELWLLGTDEERKWLFAETISGESKCCFQLHCHLVLYESLFPLHRRHLRPGVIFSDVRGSQLPSHLLLAPQPVSAIPLAVC